MFGYNYWYFLSNLIKFYQVKWRLLVSDSPGIPPSANAHELFRGFSFVAPCLLDQEDVLSQTFTNANTKPVAPTDPISKVSFI